MSEVARKLGIGRSTLYRKMRGLGLDSEDVTASTYLERSWLLGVVMGGVVR